MLINHDNIIELFYSDSRLFDCEGKLLVAIVSHGDSRRSSLQSSSSQSSDFAGSLARKLSIKDHHEGGKDPQLNHSTFKECFVRLRGNLLYIFNVGSHVRPQHSLDRRQSSISNSSVSSSSDGGYSGVAGANLKLVVLNDIDVQVPLESIVSTSNAPSFCTANNSTSKFSFIITVNFNSVKFSEKYYFVCHSKKEQEHWVQCLKLASLRVLKCLYSALKRDLKELQQKKQDEEKTLKQVQNDPAQASSPHPPTFILIKCEHLLYYSNLNPYVYVQVYRQTLLPYRSKWILMGRTETINSKAPHFSALINVFPEGGIEKGNKLQYVNLKFEVYYAVQARYELAFLASIAYVHLGGSNNPQVEGLNQYTSMVLHSLNSHFYLGTLSFALTSTSNEVGSPKDGSLLRQKRYFQRYKSLENIVDGSVKQRCHRPLLSQLRESQLNTSMPNLVAAELAEEVTEDSFVGSKLSHQLLANPIKKKFVFKIFRRNCNARLSEVMLECRATLIVPQIMM